MGRISSAPWGVSLMVRIEWIDGYPTGFQFPSGRKPDGEVETIVSHKLPVKNQLHNTAQVIGAKARGLLEVSRTTKDDVQRASIIVESPFESGNRLDYRVHLAVDPRIDPTSVASEVDYNDRSNKAGTLAALAIEYGHIGKGGVGGHLARFQEKGKEYPGKFILHRAAGIKRSGKGVG